jgi:uncharacterized protein (TIGR02145 family)
MKRLGFIMFVILALSWQYVIPQEINDIKARQNGEKIIISYNLIDNSGKYNIDLYFTTNGGNIWEGPLQSVSGEVGTGITPGYNKKITWDVLRDKGYLVSDQVQFEIRAEKQMESMNPYMHYIADSRDGKAYKVINAGNQVWMAENINYESPTGSWCYNQVFSNCDTHGRLYTWTEAQNACPAGWHLPTREEWKEFSHFVNSNRDKIRQLARNGTLDLDVKFGGLRTIRGTFRFKDHSAFYWTATPASQKNAYAIGFGGGQQSAVLRAQPKMMGLSVRCIQD